MKGVNNNLSATHVPEVAPRTDAFAGERYGAEPAECCFAEQRCIQALPVPLHACLVCVHVVNRHFVCSPTPGPRGRRGDMVSAVVLMHRDDLTKVAPRWHHYSEARPEGGVCCIPSLRAARQCGVTPLPASQIGAVQHGRGLSSTDVCRLPTLDLPGACLVAATTHAHSLALPALTPQQVVRDDPSAWNETGDECEQPPWLDCSIFLGASVCAAASLTA